jgi:hypothetical protein
MVYICYFTYIASQNTHFFSENTCKRPNSFHHFQPIILDSLCNCTDSKQANNHSSKKEGKPATGFWEEIKL